VKNSIRLSNELAGMGDPARRRLEGNDFEAVRRLLSTHESFKGDGWLADFAPIIRAYCVKNLSLAGSTPIEAAPTLYTINGIGTMLYGQRDNDVRTGSYVATLYFTFFFVPLFPISCYRVRSAGGRSWNFLAKVPYSKREKIHWAIFLAVVLWFFIVGGTQTTTSSLPASEATPASSSSPVGNSVNGYQSAPVQQSVQAEPDWYEADKRQLELIKSDVEAFDATIASSENDLRGLKSEIDAVEGGYGAYTTSDAQYQMALDRYNSAVRAHNRVVVRRGLRYDDYKTALDAFNRRVDEHNAGTTR
jgi:hypothetical protein